MRLQQPTCTWQEWLRDTPFGRTGRARTLPEIKVEVLRDLDQVSRGHQSLAFQTARLISRLAYTMGASPSAVGIFNFVMHRFFLPPASRSGALKDPDPCPSPARLNGQVENLPFQAAKGPGLEEDTQHSIANNGSLPEPRRQQPVLGISECRPARNSSKSMSTSSRLDL